MKSRQPKPENKGNNSRRPRSQKLSKLIVLIIFIIIIISSYVFLVNSNNVKQQAEPSITSNEPRAAILDGLFEKYPNPNIIQSMVQYLSNAGYAVDLYKGTNVTVDLLRKIGGYEILILRLHSSIHNDNFLYVFSGEEYTESKYVDEQLAGAVRKGYTFDENEPPYFALNTVFLGKLKPDGLNGTTLILMGCNGTANDYVIQRFFQEGIQAYISWDGYVDLTHSDIATLQIVKDILVEGLTPEEAVKKVNIEVGLDPSYGSRLVCKLP